MNTGRCLAPKDQTPLVTTVLCVYAPGHYGPHSWEQRVVTSTTDHTVTWQRHFSAVVPEKEPA